MTEHFELPADLKTQIQDEVKFQQCRFDEQTHQGIDAAIRVFARLVESWRPVPAEAGGNAPMLRLCDDCKGSGYDPAWADACETCQGTAVAEAGDNEGCGGPNCTSFGGCLVCGPEAAMEEALTSEAGDSTPSRYFVDGDGYGDPTIWQVTGPGEDDCQPIVRKCTLDGEHPVLWPTVVQALTGQPAATEGGAR
jgi:hypothetical protein